MKKIIIFSIITIVLLSTSLTISSANADTGKKKIADFVDPKKDPMSYVKRYQNEPKYKAWFDKNYGSTYKSIYDAVGLSDPSKKTSTQTITDKKESQNKVEIDKLMKKANKFFDRGSYKASISLYDKILKIDSNNIESLTNKGMALYNLGENKESIKYFDKVLKTLPNDVFTLLAKGDALANLEQYDDAVIQYDKILKIEPKNKDVLISKSNAFYNNGSVFYNAGKYKEAINNFDKVLKITPKNTLTLYWKGNAFYMLYDYQNALVYYDKVLDLEPNNANAQYMRDISYNTLYKIPENYDGDINVNSEQTNDNLDQSIMPMLEILTAKVENILYLPEDITTNLKYCDEANAFYDYSTKEITICYEFLDYLADSTTSMNVSDEIRTKIIGSVFVFTFYHELGHALIDSYDLPITGKEEDAADQISTLILLEMDLSDDEYITNGELVIYTSSWFKNIANTQNDMDRLAYWDEHSLDTQRFQNIMCMAYGSDPELYDALILQNILPADKADRCVSEYNKITRSWNILLDPYMR